MKIRQEVLDRIRAIDVSGYDPDDREEFEHKIRSINEKLDVLCEIGRALDQAWENGPFLMNFIDGDTVIGNTNYANVI